jgi:hypothetical protein
VDEASEREAGQREGLGEMFARLIDDAGNVVRAEMNVYRQSALHRVGLARGGVIKLAIGFGLFLGALLCLMIGVLMELAAVVGPLAAGAILAVGGGILGLLLASWGQRELAAVIDADDDDDKSDEGIR